MRGIRLSVLAERDLLDIWQYSFQQWDEAQADKYLDELNEGFNLLTKNATLGLGRGYVREGYRVLFVNSHAIYYTIADSSIHIVRVLHSRMDPERHL
jgi:toxin ParE1/3/4